MGGGTSTPAQIQTAQIRKQEGNQSVYIELPTHELAILLRLYIY